MEKNSTGLTPKELKMVRQAFRKIDLNGNGKISSDELARASRLLGYNPTAKEVKSMIAEVDNDRNGQIDFKEFVKMMRDHLGALEYQEMAIRDAFKCLDKDGNGFIEYGELREALLDIDEAPMTDEEFQRVVDDLDVNKDGKIDYEELARKMCSSDDFC